MRDKVQLIAGEPRRASAQPGGAGHTSRIRIHLINRIVELTQRHIKVAGHDHGA